MTEKTREAQYQVLLDYRQRHGQEQLGLMMNQAWFDDPKRLSFTFSRYKFVAKMLDGYKNVLEVGCGDAFPSRIVLQSVGALSVTDFDAVFIEDVKRRQLNEWQYKQIFVHDPVEAPIPGSYDAVYCLDVLEHIDPLKEDAFVRNIIAPLMPMGTLIIGSPSLEAQIHAAPISKAGHVNCKSMPEMKMAMERYFTNVYMFGMNDEVLHTGFHKMTHYLFALCCGKR